MSTGHLRRTPIELGRHDLGVSAVAIAPDGRVISAGAVDRVLLWNPRHPGVGVKIVGATATAIAIAPGCSHDQPRLVISHSGHGLSMRALPRA